MTGPLLMPRAPVLPTGPFEPSRMPGTDTAYGPRPARRARSLASVLLVGLLLVGALVATVLGSGLGGTRDLSGLTPRAALAAYVDANLRGDGETSWNLLCRDMQRAQGRRNQYVEFVASNAERIDFVGIGIGIGRARPARPGGAGDVVVQVFVHGNGIVSVEEVPLLWEAGAFRVCGPA